MAQSDFAKVFLGNTPSEQRKWMGQALRFLRESHQGDPQRVVIPCVGEHALVKCARDAGFEPTQIETSDISLYSSLHGYLYAGKPVQSLPFEVQAPFDEEYDLCTTDLERVAHVIWLMKLRQLKGVSYYERMYRDEVWANRFKYRQTLRTVLERRFELFEGVEYEIRDLRDVIREDRDPDSIVIVNPPAFGGGYERMFDWRGAITWTPPEIPEFNWRDEYEAEYVVSREKPELFFWYRYQNVKDFPAEEVQFAKQYDWQRADYWLCTKPGRLEKFAHSQMFMPQSSTIEVAPYPAAVFGENDEITPETRIDFISVGRDNALWYRDLWVHKLGVTGAGNDVYALMLIDGKVAGIVGLQSSHMLRGGADYVYENFGLCPQVARYPRLNRLLMICITSDDFRKFLIANLPQRNRLFVLKRLRTACLTRYRKLRLNTGVLYITARKKLPGAQGYHLTYEAIFRDDTYADCVKRWLAEEEEWMQNREQIRLEAAA